MIEGFVFCTVGDCEVGHIITTPNGNGRAVVVEVGDIPKVQLEGDGTVVASSNDIKVRRYGKVSE